jgi:hypothetical protein
MDAVETLKESGRDVVRLWPLLAVRLGEQFVTMFVVVVTILAFCIPLLVGGIIAAVRAATIETPEDAMRFFFFDHPLIIVLLVLALLVAVLLAMIIHAFIQAGVVAEFLSLPPRHGARMSWREGTTNFSFERFTRAARDGGWTVFWIYQIVWAAISLILLVPLVATLAVMYSHTGDERAIALGCGGLVLTLLLAIPLSIFATAWSQAAIVCARRDGLKATPAASAGWRALASRPGDTATLLFLFVLLSFVIIAAVILLSLGIGVLSRFTMVALMLFPLRIALTLAQTLFSLFTSNWFVAAIVRLTQKEQAV